ncbi:hypothetical protein FF38_13283 [Lucilia cuprina]|uniref:Uncharacterized protein n=1 Tax=Lucilia cuprina TaxID=7375 RepID=A0A0L0CI60_LUCCU|nr:hypothetical protein FF38_13283 [Lucilia cuprina]
MDEGIKETSWSIMANMYRSRYNVTHNKSTGIGLELWLHSQIVAHPIKRKSTGIGKEWWLQLQFSKPNIVLSKTNITDDLRLLLHLKRHILHYYCTLDSEVVTSHYRNFGFEHHAQRMDLDIIKYSIISGALYKIPIDLPCKVSNSYMLFPTGLTTLHFKNFLQNLELIFLLKLLSTVFLRSTGIHVIPEKCKKWSYTCMYGSSDSTLNFGQVSVSGADITEKFLMNLRYHPAVPRKLLTSLTDFGIFISLIAFTLSGSVLSIPPPTINPKYFNCSKQNCDFFKPIVRLAFLRQFATSSSNFKCLSKSFEIINKSSR